jgi:tripartite-type tricarboxylate transporter receptor subunit TctC
MTRKLLNGALILSLALWSGMAAAVAGGYPQRPIHVIVPYAAGSVGEVVGQLVAQGVEGRLGQRFLIETRPGAGGNIGAGVVAKAAPDGYTLLLGATNNFSINQYLYQTMDFDPLMAFTPVTLVADVPSVIFVNGKLPVSSLKEFVAYARAHPGQVNFASPSAGTTPHLAGELLNQLAGIHMVHVAYRGAGPAMAALVGGEVQMYMVGAAAGTRYLSSGAIKALAVAAAHPISALPNVPTTAEAGFPKFLASNWWGLAAPKGTSPAVIGAIYEAVAAAEAQPQFQNRFATLGLVPVASTPDEFEKRMTADAKLWSRTIKTAGLHLE